MSDLLAPQTELTLLRLQTKLQARFVSQAHDATKRNDPATIQGRVYLGLQKILRVRKEDEIFSGGAMRVRETGNDHLFAFERENGTRVIVIANFSEAPQPIPHERLRAELLRGAILHGREFLNDDGTIAPYAFVVVA